MNPENSNSEKKLIRWLLLATIALLVLVLGLQLWQMFSGKNKTSGFPQEANPNAAVSGGQQLSRGKAVMVEDVQSLNPDLSFDALAALTLDELEQLYKTGAPGMPIGFSAAASAAENYAGTNALDSVTWDVDPKFDKSPAHYEVELHHVTGDYEYKVDAYTGKVLEGRANVFQNVPSADDAGTPPDVRTPASAQDSASAPSSDPAENGGLIGEDTAKAAAFAHAGITEADAAGLQVKLDWEDGIQVYEIEFYSGNREYNYEIDANSGTVRKADLEWGAAAQQPAAYIGEDAAKQAALDHAGVSADGTVKWKLDEDHGHWIYEIEFRSGGLEYEYEINALTGAVLKAEREH